MRGSFQRAVVATAAVIICSSSVAALEEAPASSGVANFMPVFFERHSPVTALDMVQRVPGFNLSNGDTSRRGLGDSFGNLLIDGQRPSNKSLELQTVLQRIPAGDVERIELIQEALPQYDMRGHSRLVNVILREGAGQSGSWDVRLQHSESGRLAPRGQFSYTSPVGDAEVTIGIDAGTRTARERSSFVRYDGGGTLLEVERANDMRQFQEVAPTLSVNWPITERSRLRIDARAQAWVWRRRNVAFIDAPAGTGFTPLRYEQNATENHGSSWSTTATWSFDLSDTLALETIALASRRRWADGPEAYEVYDPAAGFLGAVIVDFEGHNEETALRQTLAWSPNDRHSLEIGGEIAVNARDTMLGLTRNDGTTLTPIDLPVSNTRVEETRSEIFGNHVWAINEAFNLETGLRYEFSEIAQTGDAEQTREFTYAKPSVTLNWRLDEENRLRFTGRRDIAQLQFGKFASSVDIADNNSILGNPDYVPQRTWTLEAEWERRFGEGGSFSLQVGHDWVQDLDDFVTVVTPSGVFDAPGNIGDGTNFRITGNLTSPLDRFGLSNAVLDVFLEWYNTNVEDPLTGEDRVWSGPREWELRLDYRQTFPALQMAWGWDYFWLSDGEIFRAQEYRTYDNTDGDLDVYVETTRWFGATVRVGVDALFNTGDDRERILYAGSRADGIVRSVEHRNISTGRTAFIRVSGTF